MLYPRSDPEVNDSYVRLASGLNVRVLSSGPADGPQVLLIHGWGAWSYLYRHNIPALARAGWRVLAVDLKGHGLSDKPLGPGEYTSPSMTRHAVEIMEALALGETGAAVVGQSMGGAIALDLALSRPDLVRRLVLINPVGLGRVRVMPWARWAAMPALDPILPHLVTRRAIAGLLHFVHGISGHMSPHDVDEYWAPSQFPAFSRAMRALLRDFDWSTSLLDRAHALSVPTLVVLGGRDRMVSSDPKVIEQRLPPGARIVMVPLGGHVVNEELPDEVDPALIGFLREAP